MIGLGNCGKFNTKGETKETSEKKGTQEYGNKKKKGKSGKKNEREKGMVGGSEERSSQELKQQRVTDPL